MAFEFERYLEAYELDNVEFYSIQSPWNDTQEVTAVGQDLLISKEREKRSYQPQNGEKHQNGDAFAWLNDLEPHRVGLERIDSKFRYNEDFSVHPTRLFKQHSLPASLGRNLNSKSNPDPARRRRNSVRFADEIGENLTTFLMIPSRFDDAESENDAFNATTSTSTSQKSTASVRLNIKGSRQEETTSTGESKDDAETRLFQLCFDQPAADFDDFRRRLFHQLVCLENVRIDVKSQTDGTSKGFVNHGTVLCTVKVRNIHWIKRVFARCTDDNWRNFADITALYVNDGTDGNHEYDTFAFAVRNPFGYQTSREGLDPAVDGGYLRKTAAVEFALCYQVLGSEYWDNNNGHNYRIVWM